MMVLNEVVYFSLESIFPYRILLTTLRRDVWNENMRHLKKYFISSKQF